MGDKAKTSRNSEIDAWKSCTLHEVVQPAMKKVRAAL